MEKNRLQLASQTILGQGNHTTRWLLIFISNKDIPQCHAYAYQKSSYMVVHMRRLVCIMHFCGRANKKIIWWAKKEGEGMSWIGEPEVRRGYFVIKIKSGFPGTLRIISPNVVKNSSVVEKKKGMWKVGGTDEYDKTIKSFYLHVCNYAKMQKKNLIENKDHNL